MPKEMVMPVMAESIVEAEILKWLVSEGDEVKEGQMVAEVIRLDNRTRPSWVAVQLAVKKP